MAWLSTHRALCLLIGVGLAFSVFWFWRVSASRGDAFKYLIMLRDDKWFVMSQPLSTLAFSAGYGALALLAWPPAAAAAAVNAAAGAGWVVATTWLTRTIAPVRAAWVWTAAASAGGVVVFFGYIETMAVPLMLATLYALSAQRTLAERVPDPGHGPAPVSVSPGLQVGGCGLLFGLSVAAHGQLLLLGPSWVLLVFILARRRGLAQAALFTLATVAPLVAIIGYALLNQGRIYDTLYGDALGGGDMRMFVPLFGLTTEAERYTLFSAAHGWEIANLLLRSGPWLPLLTLGAVVGARRSWLEPQSVFWALMLSGSLVFIPLWNADFGMDADWDLYAPPVMLALLAAAMLWPNHWQLGPIEVGAVAGLSIGATAITLLTFAPIAAVDPWAIGPNVTGRLLYTQFGDVAELLAVDGPSTHVRAGEAVTVTMTWRLRRSVDLHYTAAVYVIAADPAGPRVLAQHDARPVAPVDWPNPRFTDEWIVGELVPDTHTVLLAPETPPGTYELWAVLYDLNTGQRLPVGAADHAVIGRLEIAPR
jgi:hypothetical protein